MSRTRTAVEAAMAQAKWSIRIMQNAGMVERLEDWLKRYDEAVHRLEVVWPDLEEIDGFVNERAEAAYQLACFYKKDQVSSSKNDEISYQYFRKAQDLAATENLRWRIDEELGYLLIDWAQRLREAMTNSMSDAQLIEIALLIDPLAYAGHCLLEYDQHEEDSVERMLKAVDAMLENGNRAYRDVT